MNNYRPISKLCILPKVFESLISEQLISHLTEHDILSHNQSGFRKQHSTTTATTSSVSHTLIYLWRPATISTSTATNTHPPLPSAPVSHTHTSATLAQYLATFRPFWRLFFPIKRYILTNLATFLKKTLAIVQLEDVSSAAPRVRGLTPGAVSPLSASVLSSERQRNSTFSWPYRSRLVNKSFTKQHFQAPVAY